MEIQETSRVVKRSKYNRSKEDQRRLRLAYDLRIMLDQSTSEESERLKLALKKAIEMLTPTQRTYLTLYFYEGKNMQQIAELYGKDKSSISRTLHRARRNLYTYLQFTTKRFLVTDSFVERMENSKRR